MPSSWTCPPRCALRLAPGTPGQACCWANHTAQLTFVCAFAWHAASRVHVFLPVEHRWVSHASLPFAS